MLFHQSCSIAVLAGLIVGTPIQVAVPTSTSPVAPDSYGIYNIVLNHFVMGDKQAAVSVVRFTGLDSTDCIARTDSSAQWASAVADLRRQNAAAHTIEPKFDLPFRYELADTLEEVGGLRPPPPGQDPVVFLQGQISRLQEMAERHYSQVQLSAPGISADGHLAIVYVAISFAGDFHVLRKSGTSWVVQPTTKCGWIA